MDLTQDAESLIPAQLPTAPVKAARPTHVHRLPTVLTQKSALLAASALELLPQNATSPSSTMASLTPAALTLELAVSVPLPHGAPLLSIQLATTSWELALS